MRYPWPGSLRISSALAALELVERPVEAGERFLDFRGRHVERRDQPHRALSAAHQQEPLCARLLDERRGIEGRLVGDHHRVQQAKAARLRERRVTLDERIETLGEL